MIRSLVVLSAAVCGGGRPCARTRIAGVDALVAQPSRCGRPVVVFANAATARGIEEPAVARLLGGLAAAGFVAVAPELPRVRAGEVTPRTVDALVEVAGSFGAPVALIGASTGAGVSILAAGDPRLANRVSAVLAVSPFASLERILRLGTTGRYRGRPYSIEPLVARATLRSVAASAPDDPAVPALLANRNPERFDDLFAALEPRTRALVTELSPLSRIGNVAAPIELAASPDDPFFPIDEARLLAAAGPDARLTETRALAHVRPRLRPGLARVTGALERTLRHAALEAPVSAGRPISALSVRSLARP